MWWDRYGRVARWYDHLSLERPVYRAGREVGIAALGLTAGDRVLDVGCGTGLNLPLLRAAVGPTGTIVGLDASPYMLRQARNRVRRHGWDNVDLVLGDAAAPPTRVTEQRFDAVLFTYALSVIDDWRSAWQAGVDLLDPGGRIAVVDLALPTGRWRLFAPAARVACLAGGSDPQRHPWTMLTGIATDVSHVALRGGHIHVASGSVSGSSPHL